MPRETLLIAARVLLPEGTWLAPGALLARGSWIAAVGEPADLLARSPHAQRIELPGLALLPGLVNAHAHLELGLLEGRTPRGADFGAWVRGVVRERAALQDADLQRAARAGAQRCLDGGTTTVGDLDATGASERALASGGGPRAVVFRELLDAGDPERRLAALARLQAPAPSSEHLQAGLAPHGPHTASPELLAAIARAAKERALPVTIHWSETPEEGEWLEEARGPFAALLPRSPRRTGLDLLDEAGLLGPGLALVHGNHARAGERERIAQRGASLVHCPGSHAFFGRAPFDLRAWRADGVRVALGTDSLASNDTLDLRRELHRLCGAHPWLAPRDAWDMATRNGARALGLAGRVGELSPGAFADLLAVDARGLEGDGRLARLANGEFEPLHVWIGGQLQGPPPPSDSLPARAAGCAADPTGPG